MESWDTLPLLTAARRPRRNAVIPRLSLGSWKNGCWGLVPGPLCWAPSSLSPPKVLTGPHKTLTGDWGEELASRSGSVRSRETAWRKGVRCGGGMWCAVRASEAREAVG